MEKYLQNKQNRKLWFYHDEDVFVSTGFYLFDVFEVVGSNKIYIFSEIEIKNEIIKHFHAVNKKNFKIFQENFMK